jgi:hypothetical protein
VKATGAMAKAATENNKSTLIILKFRFLGNRA